ncbi:hypothetical protein GWI33_019592 [Rhynchophorus ferrugineus]|uniref:Uncharacterized protein n=1 Tax=Rhynchophorus ferrugineus TaxID=354439 RepID=A0A834M433_RHYFE|nr:hypothetical protein GWI33_019592 [Rhynchophorus ferrugineus]
MQRIGINTGPVSYGKCRRLDGLIMRNAKNEKYREKKRPGAAHLKGETALDEESLGEFRRSSVAGAGLKF